MKFLQGRFTADREDFGWFRRAAERAAGGPDSDRYRGNSLIALKKSSTVQAGNV